MTHKQKKNLFRIILTAVILIALQFIPLTGIYRFISYIITYLIIGYDILIKATKGIMAKKVFSEKFLMTIATLGAFALAIYQKSGDYNEAIAVMLFYQIGEFFEGYAVDRSKRNISELMDIRPDYANIESDGNLKRVSPSDIPIGSIIVVQPGEKVPIDGIVSEGNSTLNTVALTGESLPRSINPGDEIISGCVNLNGVLKIQTTKLFEDSTVSKILKLVEDAGSRKARSENFISSFAKIYTPIVCYLALAVAIVPPVFNRLILGSTWDFSTWIYRALIFLVISCPCALVISIPLTFFAGIGGASRNGILIKGSNFMEALSKTGIVTFDKTGTLTHGVFEVQGIHHAIDEDEKILEYAAHCECASSHPIAKSIQNAYGKNIDRSRVSNIQEISGQGITADVDGRHIVIGNSRLMSELNIRYQNCSSSGTVIHMAIDNKYAGHILISDVIKDNSKAAISELKKLGISRIVMLTGDNKKTAEDVASQLRIDETASELLPEDKVSKLEELLSQKSPKDMLAFVGDGINDAPVLRRADIGIAMGAMGSDAAIEAADVVLMDDDPLQIAKAIKISRKCLGIVYQNITFALFVKISCMLLGTLGLAGMWAAIFADVGVMVLAVLNAMRGLK